MKSRILSLLFLSVFLSLNPGLRAEPGHKFPPVSNEDRAKISAAVPAKARVKPSRPHKVLVFFLTEGFVHGSIPFGNEALKQMAEKTRAFEPTFSDDMGVFTPENLRLYDAILFQNTTSLKFADPAQRQALLDFLKSGKGLIGFHAASDNFPGWPEMQAILGGVFHGHPWGAGDTVAIKLDDPAHPLNAAFERKGFWLKEEIYQIEGSYSRDQQRVLMSLDMSKPQNQRDPKKINRTDNDFPIGWVKKIEGGPRVFYSSLGHNTDIFQTPQILQHFLDGIQFAVGDLEASAIPSAQLSPQPAPVLAPEIPSILQNWTPSVSLEEYAKTLKAYDYGRSRVALMAAENDLRRRTVKERAEVAEAIVPLLSDASVAAGAKDQICRWLAWMGSGGDDSFFSRWTNWIRGKSNSTVPALEKLAADPQLGNSAIYALIDIPGSDSDDALLRIASNAPTSVRLAAINALGRRHTTEAISTLSGLATAGEGEIAAAALTALGNIGTASALEALQSAKIPAALETTRHWALSNGALRLLQEDSRNARAQSAGIFEELLKNAPQAALRVSAATGLVRAKGDGALPEIIAFLKDPDMNVRMAAANLAATIPGRNTVAQIGAEFVHLEPFIQTVLIQSFSGRQAAEVRALFEQNLANPQPEVRRAALAALGKTGNGGSVERLFPFLAAGGDDAKAAIQCLSQIPDIEVSQILRSKLSSQQGAAKSALLQILGNRLSPEAMDAIVTATGESDNDVRAAAFGALARLSKSGDLAKVVALHPNVKTGPDQKGWGGALLAAVRSASAADENITLLVQALPQTQGEPRRLLITTLATIDTPKARDSLNQLLQSPNLDQRKECIRALSAARTQSAIPLLLQAARQSKDVSEQVHSVRGYLDVVGAQRDKEQKPGQYEAIWELAPRPEEKDAILSAIRNLNNTAGNTLLKKLDPARAAVLESTENDLRAVDADISNTGALFEQGEDAITNWNEPRATLRWKFSVKNPGTYKVSALQSYQGQPDGEYQIVVKNQVLAGKVQPTENWGAFKTVDVGELRLDKDTVYTLEVKPVKFSGYLMNLKKVTLKLK